MLNERISVTPKIMELQDTNDIYMTMNLRILSTEKNLNGAIFQKSFLEGTVNDKEKFTGLPFVVNKDALENDEYLTHELDTETGELKTDQVGSFVDFWIEEEEDKDVLVGEVRIFKRFPTVCSKILEMYSDNTLSTSCEVAITKYDEISEDGERYIGYNDGGNTLIGSAIVTEPAMVDAKPTLLIAEAYQKDIEFEQQGGGKVSKKKEYNNGIKVEYIGELETSSLKFYEIEQQIFNIVNPTDPKTGIREYNYYIHTLYNDKVIFESESNYNILYSAGYKVENDTIILDKQDDWEKGSFQFVPDGVSVNELIEANSKKILEMEQELNALKEEKEEMSKEKEKNLEVNEENEVALTDLEKEVADLKETIVSELEAKADLKAEIDTLKAEVEALKPYKEQVEKAEKEAAIKELNDKYSNILSEDTFNSEEVKKAIEANDVATLNDIVVQEVAKKAVEKVDKKDVEIAAAEPKELVEQTDRDYLFSTRE